MGILNRYTKTASPGYAAFKTELSWEQRDYIMYLLFQEGIYTEFSDEDGFQWRLIWSLNCIDC
ncbi:MULTISPECIES: hypothetical protein [Bacteroides]|uniref:hypothetical protein n=1 Tax=Bacteroides TaxID=816 RepID=UPI000375A0F8|nr:MULTISPECIES: hypothetical protein [Bacteroides]EOA52140.1 hypothetical protein HMPREF1214_04759 [Bacteroides sp. HPS0048]MBD9109946.1 hypothetical protein [Bacteroides nordii]MCE8463522.1 hypothetical protein [Bacteroides nordii]UYU49031.1 hypothetical protein KQP55_00050 [Bacteroides nordii]